MKDLASETLCFGLDIGTRTVIGVVGYKENGEFVVLDWEKREHEERAMLDGQIHDIDKVARVVYEVKCALEKRLDRKLTEVAIAAAGRSLSTQIVEVVHTFEEEREVTLADIHHLELEGVEKAKESQQNVNQRTDYFCVAYTVMHYYIDGYLMANLEGHRGHEIKAEMIATFLPKQVTDSLYAVTERAELKVQHLTLEPIAAINATIPEGIRMLNLALVDIGAGTSDIALTKDGSIIAYGMIPLAGDEVTEAIVHNYLVDFNTAEMMKAQIGQKEPIVYKDILGIEGKTELEEIEAVVMPAIEEVTKAISEKIMALNGGVPNAVFCVGGGSQMLEVPERIAKHLELIPSRVALRSTKHLEKIRDEAGLEDSPDMITPIGICVTALENKYSEFTLVVLNGHSVQLLNAKQLTLLDAIVAKGIDHTEIFPVRGKTLMFKLNGERLRIKGEKGIPATLLLNHKPATINDHIQEGDQIEIEFATPGRPGEAIVKDYIKETKTLSLEGSPLVLPLIKVNGELKPPEYAIMQGDEIEIQEVHTLGELTEAMNWNLKEEVVTVNLTSQPPEYELASGDEILIHSLKEKKEENKALNEKPSFNKSEEALVNHKEEKESQNRAESLYVVVNGQTVALPNRKEDYIFAAIFDYIDFDLTKPQGTIQLKRNGAVGALTDILKDGDILEISWKK